MVYFPVRNYNSRKNIMDTDFNQQLAKGYTSKSQIARILTETWTAQHMYCPVCGCPTLLKFPNNKAVADFYCPECKNEFEQKSKSGSFGAKIADGAYDTFIQRISSNNNPDFFFMSYSLEKMRVENLFFVPKYFFVPEIVEKRKPLTENAKRAGWVGCNILFNNIPVQGRIPIIQDGQSASKALVMKRVKQAEQIRIENITERGWLLDVLDCVNMMNSDIFSLDMIYSFESSLSVKHPKNNNIRAKIRQQLQQLRDRGEISFLGNGVYQRIDRDDWNR